MSKPTKPAKKPAKALPKHKAGAKPAPKAPLKTATKPGAKPALKSAPKPAPSKPASKPVTPVKGAAGAKPVATVDDKHRKGAVPVPVKPPAGKPVPGKPVPVTGARPLSAPKKGKAPSAPIPLPAGVGRLMDMKFARKPLIPSGPKAAHTRPLGQHGGYAPEVTLPQAKTPFNAEELDAYRQLLLRKRAELLIDVKGMEDQALKSGSGALSNMPSHMAEQGSEAYDQSLSLDLAAADRRIIKEIDGALKRIADGTFGVCEHSGKTIRLERLKELPWARFTIESAREIERQSMRG